MAELPRLFIATLHYTHSEGNQGNNGTLANERNIHRPQLLDAFAESALLATAMLILSANAIVRKVDR